MVKYLIYGGSAIAALGMLVACRAVSPDSVSPDPLPETETPSPALEGPPPPPGSAFMALLTPEQTAQIKRLGVPLVVPTAIPAGFSVTHVDTEQTDRGQGYRILYRDGGDRCFLVEYASAGVGSPPSTEYRLPIQPPLFAGDEEYGLNYGRYTDPMLREQFPESALISDWLPKGDGVYRLVGASYINDTLDPVSPCQDVTPEEAVEIVESFALMTEEIMGDG